MSPLMVIVPRRQTVAISRGVEPVKLTYGVSSLVFITLVFFVLFFVVLYTKRRAGRASIYWGVKLNIFSLWR